MSSRRDAGRRKAPVGLTGGGGFGFENSVAARFLLDLLGGTNSLGIDFGRIVRVDWQARDAGWLADDLALTCTSGPGGDRAAGLSIKSNRQVTASGFPTNFVAALWAQWLGIGTLRPLAGSQDALVLVTGELAQNVEAAWSRLLREASKTTPERLIARLSSPKQDEGSQASDLQRALFESLHCPKKLRNQRETDEKATVHLLRQIRLMRFDYEVTPSRHMVEAVADCQKVLRSSNPAEAGELWKRLTGIADEKRPAGGSLDLPGLLQELRGQFDLAEHPDFARDWETLERRSQEEMSEVRTDIGGQRSLPRRELLAAAQTALDQRGACFLAGESGSGKSALAKEIAAARYRRVIWLTGQMLDRSARSEVERALHLNQPIVEIVRSSPVSCLIVFDAVEGYPERALRMAAHLVRDIHGSDAAAHIHFLFSAQVEAASRTIRRLAEFGTAVALLETTPVPRPSEDDVSAIARQIPRLGWAVRRLELRPLLTNLKILDWCARTLQAGSIEQDHPLLGLTDLIDLLWEHWAEAGDNSLARSHVLMRIAALEAETLSASVPRLFLDYTEQQTLLGLIRSDLVRLREERVRFSHDLLGDWARMRVLIGDDPISSADGRKRAEFPQWHRAIRLFAQRLLERSGDGADEWRRAIERLDDEQVSSTLLRDLFLEALFLATNAADLLERTWPVLTANGGKLLNRLLDRFLFVATLPDPRLSQLTETPEEATRFQHLFRVPFGPYWGPLLTVLRAHLSEVATVAPYNLARVCSLWLKTTPVELRAGLPTPWRREAAELVLATAREIQARDAAGGYYSGKLDRAVYEAALYAAPDLPQEIGQLCLELAQRRDMAADIAARVRAAHQKRAEARGRREESSPHAERLAGFSFARGRRRTPWPDGPRDPVDSEFMKACLAGDPFCALLRADPAVALEVLLAVCIEHPKEDDVFSHRYKDECALSYSREGSPPMYFRGPFLPFLRTSPEYGISFVIKLTNFATRRFSGEERGLAITVDGAARKWLGDTRVFQWPQGWPLSDGSLVESALMALERWLYEAIDAGVAIEARIERIMRESESLAFASRLIEVGKRAPSLFGGVLKPLLHVWELWDLDFRLVTQRLNGTIALGSWMLESPQLTSLARDWYGMPHRRQMLISWDGPVIGTMMVRDECHQFFGELRAQWSPKLDERGDPSSLRYLIERMNPQNYTFEERDGERVIVDFQWPEELKKDADESLAGLAKRRNLSMSPMRCRQVLDEQTPPSAEQLRALWDLLQTVDAGEAALVTDDGVALLVGADILCAGIAVLLTFHRAWLLEDPARINWCRQQLGRIFDNPPAPMPFDSEAAVGTDRWDAFAAECGVLLLAENNDDLLARRLVAAAVMAFHYQTTGLAFSRAVRCRERLGLDFNRMLVLAVRWAGLRVALPSTGTPALQGDCERALDERVRFGEAFVDRSLTTDYHALNEVDAHTLAARDALHAKRYPEHAKVLAHRRQAEERRGSREVLHARDVAIDYHVIAAAFSWLDIGAARSADERADWLRFVHELLDGLIGRLPVVDDPRKQEIDGLPSEFDGWIYQSVAQTIPQMTPVERPEALWRPILNLGAPAHDWVERFFWYWFTNGAQAASSPADFVRCWREMILYALGHPRWDPDANLSHGLGNIVSELLGFDRRWTGLSLGEDAAAAVGNLKDVFEKAAQRWFGMPDVTRGFLGFAAKPGGARLLLPGVFWVAKAVEAFDSYDWRNGVEDSLVHFLDVCWQRESAEISADAELRKAFLGLLSTLVSRGGHAAIALRDRFLASLGV
jgi:hypothetical protein